MPPFTVLTAEFQNEINSFSIVPTTLDSYRHDVLLFGEEALAVRADANTELAGFADAARAYGWKLVHTVSAIAEPAGAVTRDAYDRIAGVIVAAARAHAGRLDGVLLGLHGAMVTEFTGDGEGELLRRVRGALGMDIPIAITLDPHANVSRAMCDLANIIVSYKTYPHVDIRDTAFHAGTILQRAMTGEIHPVTIRVVRPMLEEANGGRTDVGAMLARLDQAREYERRPDVFAVSINSGFPNADADEVGSTVLVTGEGDLQSHVRFASAIADDMWRCRGEVLEALYPPAEAVGICREHWARHPFDSGPVVLADYADNPGGGAYGDGTNLLAAMLDGRITEACFGPVVDPDVVARLADLTPGQRVQVSLGGKTDAAVGGPPLEVDATLMSLSNGDWTGSGAMMAGLTYSWGPTAVLRVDCIDILVVSKPFQILDLEQFRAFGIDPAAKRVVGLKSMQHFRAVFQPIAARILLCDSGALCTRDYRALPFNRIPRPMYPLDPDIDLEHWLSRHGDGVHVPDLAAVARIDASMRRVLSEAGGSLPGVAVAVVYQGTILHVAGYGYANLEHEVPVTGNTMFQSASTGKMFTAAAVLLLARDGLLDLDGPVTDFIPQASEGWSGITIRSLLTMTSGLGDYGWSYDGTSGESGLPPINLWQDYTEDQIVDLAAGSALYFAPGTSYRYSNIGYDLLGIIVERVTGAAYHTLLNERVFKPLGMTSARAADCNAIVPHRAACYSLVGGELVNSNWMAPSLLRSGAGGLMFSVHDAARWLLELDSPRHLDAALLEQMFTPGCTADGVTTITGYAHGWKQSEVRGMQKFRHGGMTDGLRTEFMRIPALGLSVAVFANSDEADPARIASIIAGAVDEHAAPYEPIVDHDTAATARDAQLLARLAADITDLAGFTEAARERWQGTLLEQAVGNLRDVYAKAVLRLSECRDLPEGRARRYVFAVGSHQVHWGVVRTADGRVADMRFIFE